MVDEAARQLGFQLPALIRTRGTDLQLLEYFKVVNNDIAPLTNWLLLNTQAPDSALQASPILPVLARLQRCQLYYTTNYDDFNARPNSHPRY